MSSFEAFPRVALLARRGRFLVGEAFFGRARRVTVQRDRRAQEGRLALLRPARGGGKGAAQVERILGRPDVARDVLEALMLDRGLARGFEPRVERAAEEPAREFGGRRDLRDLVTFTIDPATARDFDDAISAESRGDGAWRVWVHIADVAAHVPPGGPVDKEAARRATSVYVPGLVEPMLPSSLSNRACSLVPGEDRLAVTVELDLVGSRVERVAFHRSLIRSDARLDYDRVDRIFAGAERAEDPWAASLAAARAAAGALGEARSSRGALVIASSEPEFEFDREGHVTSLRPSVQTESHRVIEHLMILANEQVATYFDQGSVPALFRVHEQPEPAAVKRLVEQLASLSVPTPPVPDLLSGQQSGELVGEISRLIDAHVRRAGHGRRGLTTLMLRALKQARYDPRSLGHAGLSSPRYCHFTSPIRRYPDLVDHRALLGALGLGEDPPGASRLARDAEHSSERERAAMSIERSADDVARCFLLERELFETLGWEHEWDGEVIGVIGAGAFVSFGDGHEGMLPVRRLRGDWWELNAEETMLRGSRSGATLRLGDPVRVRVGRVESARGRVDLVPVEEA